MKISPKCIESTRRARVVLKENGKSFILDNKKEDAIDITKVDNCAITSGERCDYRISNKVNEVFIELKGSDIKKALSQISSTIDKIAFTKSKNNRAAAVVSSRYPKEDSSTMVAKRKLMATYVRVLHIKNSVIELSSESIL